MIIPKIRKSYFPGIHSPKTAEQIVEQIVEEGFNEERSLKRGGEKKEKEKIAIHLVNITNEATLDVDSLKVLKYRPPQEIRSFQIAKFRKVLRK